MIVAPPRGPPSTEDIPMQSPFFCAALAEVAGYASAYINIKVAIFKLFMISDYYFIH
jgi:hypothetical protein